MKKLLFLLTIGFTFTLTGCNSTEKDLQQVLDTYADFIIDEAYARQPNTEAFCEEVFANAYIQECIDSFTPNNEDVVHLFQMDINIEEFTEFTHDDLSYYDKIYLVNFTVYMKVQVQEEIDGWEDTSEDYIFIVLEDGEYKALLLNPALYMEEE